jgi:DNA-binding response OmpR family regulator
MAITPGSAAAGGASPPDASLPLSPSTRCAALGRINDEHREEGYAETPRASIKKRAHKDDAEMRRLVAESLLKDGYEVELVPDGGHLLVALARQFADALRLRPFDLVVSDIRMPVCTGLEIVEQLRLLKCSIPVVLLTGFGDADTRLKALALDAILFEKPFDVDELRIAVASLLWRQRIRRR